MKVSKIFFTTTLILIGINQIYSQNKNDTLFVATWNVENLFDAIDDMDKNDEEFLPLAEKKWTPEKIDQKINNLAQVIRWMNTGKGPDLLGVQEVEHQYLIDTLLQRHFRDKNYKVAYQESLDKRGIDNGLIYDANKFEVLNIKPIEVELPSKYPTRYILEVKLKSKSGEEIFAFINHWPSRGGGEEKSQPNRIKTATVLRNEIDLLISYNKNINIILLGDFNDVPNSLSIARYLWSNEFNCSSKVDTMRLYNLAYKSFLSGKGTYLYRSTWNMLDQIIVSNNLVSDGNFKYVCDSFHLIKPEFMIQKEGRYKGSAMPTFGGRKYLGGFSDHIPVAAKFLISK